MTSAAGTFENSITYCKAALKIGRAGNNGLIAFAHKPYAALQSSGANKYCFMNKQPVFALLLFMRVYLSIRSL